jgi:hypothetical protein
MRKPVIEIEVDDEFWLTPEDEQERYLRQRAETMKASILRHIDGIKNICILYKEDDDELD